MRLGAHLSIAKGLDKAAETAANIGANTFQFLPVIPGRQSPYHNGKGSGVLAGKAQAV